MQDHFHGLCALEYKVSVYYRTCKVLVSFKVPHPCLVRPPDQKKTIEEDIMLFVVILCLFSDNSMSLWSICVYFWYISQVFVVILMRKLQIK